MKKRVSLTISIPAFNEEETLEKVVNEALIELKKITTNYELVLVDDGSTDKTKKIMESFAKIDNHVKIVYHKKNLGFSGAIKSSFENASKELVLLAPADGQFNFKELPEFVRAINGCDAVLAFRKINHEPFIRRFQSWFYHNLSKTLLRLTVKEIPTISLWRRASLQKLTITVNPRSNMALPQLIYQSSKLGYKFAQIPIIWHPRRGGEAKGRINLFLIFSTLIEMGKLFLEERLKPT